MKRTYSAIMIGVAAFLFLMINISMASTAAEGAKNLAEKAAAYVKANGKEKAIAEINNPNGQFIKGDLYVIMDDFEGNHLANGGNPKIIGRNMLDAKDADGLPITRRMIELARKGGGWLDHSWTNPATKKIQKKSTYIKRVDGMDIFVGCGVWK